MALEIFPDAGYNPSYSQDSEFENPFSITFDGVTGGVIQKKLYIGNNIAAGAFYYTNVGVFAVDTDPLDLIGGTEEYSWKVKAGNDQPLAEEWSLITAGDIADMPNMPNDSSTYLPFWVRIEIPRGVDVQSFDTIKLKVTATESL